MTTTVRTTDQILPIDERLREALIQHLKRLDAAERADRFCAVLSDVELNAYGRSLDFGRSRGFAQLVNGNIVAAIEIMPFERTSGKSPAIYRSAMSRESGLCCRDAFLALILRASAVVAELGAGMLVVVNPCVELVERLPTDFVADIVFAEGRPTAWIHLAPRDLLPPARANRP